MALDDSRAKADMECIARAAVALPIPCDVQILKLECGFVDCNDSFFTLYLDVLFAANGSVAPELNRHFGLAYADFKSPVFSTLCSSPPIPA